MNQKNLIGAVGGVLLAVSAFLPWASVLGMSLNGFQGSGGNPGIFFVI
jgi:hypothetical protein